jgi:lipoprotein-releasing system ATP-binding protein
LGEPLLLSLQSVAKSYQSGHEQLQVLQDVNLRIEAGSSVVITGESGSGKTTLLNLVAGLDSPSGGRVDFEGVDLGSLSETELALFRSRNLGFIFQFHYLLRDFTALENVMMPALIAGEPAAAGRDRAGALLAEVGLGDREHHYPPELSGGEQQRVAVARALMNTPRLVVADEPTGNLDERNSAAVEDLLFSLVARHRTTLLMATHDRRLAAKGRRRLTLVHGVLEEQ